MTDISRRHFSAAVATGILGSSAAARLIANTLNADGEAIAVGPMVGHVSESSAHMWYRPAREGRYTLVCGPSEGPQTFQASADSRLENDLCIHWRLDGLAPATRYDYRILLDDKLLCGGPEYHFQTAPDPTQPARVCLAFGSCADTEPLPLWMQMEQKGAQALVLLGDTPYIDSTDLAVARRKHRNFLLIPELAGLARHTPTWGTWDDHDFGKNDSDGRLDGKERTRQAFLEYRANATFGERDQGIYTKFRYGPIEVFLLDTRWFARTEVSPVDPAKLTLLGSQQWEWLRRSLKESTATFKLIACGMIWDDKRSGESDDWHSYSHERSALLEFLGREEISGVVLIGGDIHCSRLLSYKSRDQVGYDLHQFIVSPIHNRTIESLNVPHPDLVHGEAVPHVWLRIEADTTGTPARLHAKWEQMHGRQMWEISLTDRQLARS
jgi:alkaline phosphatase D